MFSSDRYVETDKDRGEKERGREGGRKGARDEGVGEESRESTLYLTDLIEFVSQGSHLQILS